MFEKKFVRSLLYLVVVVCLTTTAAMGANILFVTPMEDGYKPGEERLKAFMEDLGHTVTYIDDEEDEAVTEAAAAAADLVFICDSAHSDGIKNEITEIETPMVINDSQCWDEMGLTHGEGGDENVASTDIEIVELGHFLSAGFSGTVTILTDIKDPGGEPEFGKGIAGDEAAVIATATLNDGQTYDVIFVYEKGAALAVPPADGSPQVAADLRVCFGFDIRTYPLWNENAYALFEAAINCALGLAEPPAQAWNPSPRNGATDVPQEVFLAWRPGTYVEGLSPKHRVFFGESFIDVNQGVDGVEQDAERYPVEGSLSLDLGKTCYWRVDEANSTIGWDVGAVWRFTIADYLVVEDFEDYSDSSPNIIYEAWADGWENPENGSNVGHLLPDLLQGEHYVETTIVHSGKQSMPYYYDNTGTVTNSQAQRTFSPVQDWTREGVDSLTLWFRGHPTYVGSFVEAPAGTYTMTGSGTDIWNTDDEFHFAFKEYTGAGTIIAKVESVQNTHETAKAGVMIRDTLDADSRYTGLFITPENGVRFQYRNTVGGFTDRQFTEGITAPYWVKLERTSGGLIRAYYSADGTTWERFNLTQVMMNTPMYIGLALTSHDAALTCEAKFSNVSFPGTNVDMQWTDQDIGMLSNEPEQMYVTVADGSGTAATVYHNDPDSALINTWTQWNIDTKEFGDAGVVLTDVSKLAIGFGGADNPQPGGSGLVFFDDIRLYLPAP